MGTKKGCIYSKGAPFKGAPQTFGEKLPQTFPPLDLPLPATPVKIWKKWWLTGWSGALCITAQYSEYRKIRLSQSQAKNRPYLAATRHCYQSLPNEHYVLAVFIDLAKAYDMVCIDALLFNLLKVGINERMFDLIRTRLTNRRLQLSSRWLHAIYGQIPANGIPHGSILSPILFSIVVKDLPDGIRSSATLCANDFSFWESGSCIKQIKELFA